MPLAESLAKLWGISSWPKNGALLEQSPMNAVLAQNNANMGDALCSQVENFNFWRSHAKENGDFPSIILLLCKEHEFIIQVFQFLGIKPKH
jgi:hypothetical protein